MKIFAIIGEAGYCPLLVSEATSLETLALNPELTDEQMETIFQTVLLGTDRDKILEAVHVYKLPTESEPL